MDFNILLVGMVMKQRHFQFCFHLAVGRFLLSFRRVFGVQEKQQIMRRLWATSTKPFSDRPTRISAPPGSVRVEVPSLSSPSNVTFAGIGSIYSQGLLVPRMLAVEVPRLHRNHQVHCEFVMLAAFHVHHQQLVKST